MTAQRTRLLTTIALALGVLALLACAPMALAEASSSPSPSEAPATTPTTTAPASAQASAPTTTATTTPSTTEAPPSDQPGASTTQTTAALPPAASPEAVTQRSQPSSGEAAVHRQPTHSAALPHVAVGGSTGGTNAAAHAPQSLAPTPTALTPALPPTLAGLSGGVPSFFINSFSIPPFLLPIYQAAGAAYGIPWQVLAAINEVETDYGRDLSISSAGAEGWMQFLPAEWSQFGVDVNNDGFEDPYNPADAIFAAARYLADAGGARNIRAAVFAYNHSNAYVESVMLRARLLGGTPPALLGAVTALTEGRFPVHAPSHYSDGFSTASTGATLVGTTIYSQPDAPAIATQDGRIVRMGQSPALGRYVALRDVYGNTYTYAQLGTLATLYPVLEGAKRFSLHALRPGVRVISGTVLGHLAGEATLEPHMLFEIRPAGAGAPLIDPKPLLDDWVKLEDSSAIRASNGGSLRLAGPTPGQALLESKARLERQIARERRVPLASCERRLISEGRVDRRVLALIQFLTVSGLTPTVSASSCAATRRGDAMGKGAAPAGSATVEGAAPAGSSLDIAAVDGHAMLDAGRASAIARTTVRRLLRLQGTMRPTQIAGPPGLPKAANLLVVRARSGGLRISFGARSSTGAHTASLFSSGLSPLQWLKLIARLGQIPNPTVVERPSPASVPDPAATSALAGGHG